MRAARLGTEDEVVLRKAYAHFHPTRAFHIPVQDVRFEMGEHMDWLLAQAGGEAFWVGCCEHQAGGHWMPHPGLGLAAREEVQNRIEAILAEMDERP